MVEDPHAAWPRRVATAVVTGGARGIGFHVAEQLADRGLRVVVVARDAERGRRAVAELQAGADRDVELVVGDVGCRRTVAALADALLEVCPRIDVLVHNAGVWPSRRELNEDGFEQAFATNHLAPFQLNHLLEERLAESGGRVVQIGAGLYVKGRADPERTPAGEDFHPIRTYADTKLCNLTTLPRFAERWAGSGITIDTLHPGVIRTGLGDRGGPLGLLLKVVKRTWTPPARGAAPVVRLALDAPPGSGRWFVVDEETAVEGAAADPELGARLWEHAERVTLRAAA